MTNNDDYPFTLDPEKTNDLLKKMAADGFYPKPKECKNGPYQSKEVLCGDLGDIEHRTLDKAINPAFDRPFPFWYDWKRKEYWIDLEAAKKYFAARKRKAKRKH